MACSSHISLMILMFFCVLISSPLLYSQYSTFGNSVNQVKKRSEGQEYINILTQIAMLSTVNLP